MRMLRKVIYCLAIRKGDKVDHLEDTDGLSAFIKNNLKSKKDTEGMLHNMTSGVTSWAVSKAYIF